MNLNDSFLSSEGVYLSNFPYYMRILIITIHISNQIQLSDMN